MAMISITDTKLNRYTICCQLDAMKIYVRSDIERLGDDRFNRIHSEIRDAIIKDKIPKNLDKHI